MNRTSDILVIGGGIVGLAIAIELKLRGAAVTVLSRDFAGAATHAAAGMLAPHSEDIPPGPMLELCLKSLALYPDWVHKLEEISGLSAGYWPCGSLAPVYQLDGIPQSTSTDLSLTKLWFNRDAIHYAQSGFGADVMGGWWFPEDAQVDNRALAKALWSTAQSLGVDIQEGVSVTGIQQQQGRVIGVRTAIADWQADHYI
ncbi:MAG TPA: FAD-dependent oxidoreductase, partial [Crinalium sp.]